MGGPKDVCQIKGWGCMEADGWAQIGSSRAEKMSIMCSDFAFKPSSSFLLDSALGYPLELIQFAMFLA